MEKITVPIKYFHCEVRLCVCVFGLAGMHRYIDPANPLSTLKKKKKKNPMPAVGCISGLLVKCTYMIICSSAFSLCVSSRFF